jgi:hypothetical protein
VLFDKQKTALVMFPPGKGGVYAIPKSVTQIRDGAFRGAVNLTAVVLPAGVSSVDWRGFYSCGRQLSSFYFEGNAPGLANEALAGCDNSTVYHRAGATGWGKEFGGRPTAVWDGKAPAGK